MRAHLSRRRLSRQRRRSHRSRSPRHAVLALALALLGGALLALLLPAGALAHAQLEGSAPARGAVVAQQPEQVVFRFSEPVEGNFGAVRVFDSAGARVDAGEPFHPGERSAQLAVRLRDGLADGTYSATYRVVSADAHIVSGGVVFSIGRAGAAGRTVGELLAGGEAGAVSDVAFGIARGLQFAALAAALGALLFWLLVWGQAVGAAASRVGAGPAAGVPLARGGAIAGAGRVAWRAADAAFARRLRALVAIAALVGVLSAALGIAMQGAVASGRTLFVALDATIVGETLGTRFGTVWGIGLIAWAALGALAWIALAPRRERGPRGAHVAAGSLAATEPAAPSPSSPSPSPSPPPSPSWPASAAAAAQLDPPTPSRSPLAAAATRALAIPAAFLFLLPGLGGHAAAQAPVAIGLPANVVHVAAMSLWTGGLAVLLLVLPAATRALPAAADRSRLLAATLLRFSPLALGAVAAILLTGIVQSIVLLDRLGDLVDSGFGRAILVKGALLLVLIALGAHQRRRSLPRLRAIAAAGEAPGGAGVVLRRVLRAELLLVVGALVATTFLAALSPSGTGALAGPFDRTTAIGPLQLQLTVDPAAVGPNVVHAYLLDPVDGSQFRGARELTIAASEPQRGIGPISEPADLAGPGHYTIAALSLGAAGTWRLRVTVRVSDFDEYTTTVEVPIR